MRGQLMSTHDVRLEAREEYVIVHDRDLAPSGGGEPKVELMLLSERRAGGDSQAFLTSCLSVPLRAAETIGLSTRPVRSSATRLVWALLTTIRVPIEAIGGEDDASEEACWDVSQSLAQFISILVEDYVNRSNRQPTYCGDATRSDIGVMVTWTETAPQWSQPKGTALYCNFDVRMKHSVSCLLHSVSADMHSTGLNKNRLTELHVLSHYWCGYCQYHFTSMQMS